MKKHPGNTMINSDLANARQIIMITFINKDNRVQFVKEMQTKFKELDKSYSKITFEEKLFLLALALNLMLDAYQTDRIDKKMKYKHKIMQYNETLFKQALLTDLQKAKWSVVIAKTHGLIKYYLFANKYYEQAIDFVKLASKIVKKESEHLLLDINIRTAEINIESGTHFETEEIAPDLAYEANTRVVKAINAALKLIPDQALAVRLYLMKTQALNKLAIYQYERNKQPKKVALLWVNAMETATAGLGIAMSQENSNCLVNHLKSCCEKLSILITKFSKKENFNSIASEIKKINTWLIEGNLKKITELQQLIDNISQNIAPATKLTSFWQKPVSPENKSNTTLIIQKMSSPEFT